MITFQKIRWKNFLSTGDHWSEIDFLGHTTNLVVGTNGSGKSTMLDALTFSLFNKPFRKINKSQLINATNEKDCVVEVEFTVNNKDYLVRRSIKPNKFDIEVNGTLLHKESDDRLNQKILEENILKVNYKSFTQIVILGSSSFVPFMQLSTSNRRDVIEDLLDIRIFSAMNSLIKEKIRTEKEKIRSLDLKRDNIKDKISMQENFIKELEEQGKTNIAENKKKRDKLGDEICVLIMKTEGLEDDVYGLTEEQKKLTGAGEKLLKEITKLNNGISKNNTQISGYQRQIRDLESEVQRFTEQLANRSTENEKLNEFNSSLQKTLEESSERREEVVYHDFAYSLLKDDGVKTKIIKKYLPFINQQVNRYLQLMDFYINFTLNEEFVETVKSPIHEDFSYSSFSEGEKMRIDLALLFTWREVARVKNSVNTNLLIMDEIFDSSLDGFGTDEFLKIIRFVIKDANVFVISHKTELHDKFNSVIKFDKVKGFSRIVS
jgi:DNA repair exonuclease SbcCD ATPase subunit